MRRCDVEPPDDRLLGHAITALQHRVEPGSGNGETGVGGVATTNLPMVGVRVRGELGDAVEERKRLLRHVSIGCGLRSPDIPRQDLDLVQGGHVAHEAAGHEPRSTHAVLLDSEVHRVVLARAARTPGPGRRAEPVRGDVRDVVLDPQRVNELLVELGVQNLPPSFGFIPVLADPVVLVLAGTEVVGCAVGTGRNEHCMCLVTDLSPASSLQLSSGSVPVVHHQTGSATCRTRSSTSAG